MRYQFFDLFFAGSHQPPPPGAAYYIIHLSVGEKVSSELELFKANWREHLNLLQLQIQDVLQDLRELQWHSAIEFGWKTETHDALRKSVECDFPGCTNKGRWTCSGCLQQSYCSTEHSGNHWRGHHRSVCTLNTGLGLKVLTVVNGVQTYTPAFCIGTKITLAGRDFRIFKINPATTAPLRAQSYTLYANKVFSFAPCIWVHNQCSVRQLRTVSLL
jgi:hypothetical protein